MHLGKKKVVYNLQESPVAFAQLLMSFIVFDVDRRYQIWKGDPS